MFLEQGWLRLFRLVIAGKTAAILYAYQYRGRVYHFATGIDSSMSHLEPGHLMNEMAIAHSINEDNDEYDFLWGEEHYKYSWGATDRLDHVRELINSPRVKVQRRAVSTLRKIKLRLQNGDEQAE
jgi:CelD/BcsL family acetyltransferase involved in cellulose biosynthesis